MNFKSFFASSVDPTQLSTTIQAGAKMLGFVITYFAAMRGFNPAEATNLIQYIADTLITVIPAIFALYHGAIAVFGAVRKLIVLVGAK